MWTDERVATLRRGWAEGLSASQIAKQLGGTTRNAVLSKVHRIGLAARNTPDRPRTRRRAEPNIAKGARITARYESKRMEKPQPVAPLNIPFLDRQPDQCRAITDPTRFAQKVCGHQTDETSIYCAAHRALFYVPHKKPAGRVM